MLSKSNIAALVSVLEYKNGLSSTQVNGDFQLGVNDANLFLEDKITAEGPMTCISTLNVSGNTTLQGATTILSTLNISGNTLMQGPITGLSSFNISGNTTLQGATTILSTLNVSGTATFNTLRANEVQQLYSPGSYALLVPTGTVNAYAGLSAPNGWLICDGSAVSRTTYATLFALISTTYGVGNGSTTFNLPNLKGRVIVGFNAAESEFDSLGETGGAKTHTLTTNEIPSHTHSYIFTNDGSDGYYNTAGATHAIDNQAATTGATGGGQAHNNLQPYITLNYIIKF
jgi:microcystin-dependent protein